MPSDTTDAPFAFKMVAGVNVPAEQCTAPDYKGCIVARRDPRRVRRRDGACGAHPEVCIDWCDAYACCWAGKRMWGEVDRRSSDEAG